MTNNRLYRLNTMASTSRISLLAYLAALLTLCIAIVLALVSWLWLSEWRRVVAHRAYIDALNAGTMEHAAPLLELAHREPFMGHFLGFNQIRARDAAEVFAIVQLLESRQFDSAVTAFAGSEAIDRVVQRSSLQSPTPLFKALAEALQAERSATQDLSDDSRAIAQLENRYNIVAREFGELLSLPTMPFSPNEAANFYSSGLLAGLPKLSELPDDITDELALKSELERLGGEVSLRGEDAGQAFRERLSSIRMASEALSDEWIQLSRRGLEFQERVQALRNRTNEAGRLALDGMRFLAAHVDPISMLELTTLALDSGRNGPAPK